MNTIESEPRTSKGRYQLLSSPPGTRPQKAFDRVSNTTVVIEKLRDQPQAQADIQGLGKFQDLTLIGHSSLVNIKDFFSDAEGEFIVLESVEGRTLLELFSMSRHPTLSDLMRWFDQLLDVLAFLNTRKEVILHGDIQPANIWITPDSTLKLSCPATGCETIKDTGSEAYRSLELLWGGLDMSSRMVISRYFDAESESVLKTPPDERSDVYAASAVVYFGLTATVPLDVISRATELAATGRDPLVPPNLVNPSVSEQVAEVVMKGMAIRREDRFRSANEMRAALCNTIAGLYDDLTGLPNETQFTNHVLSAIRDFEENDRGPFAVLLLEVNELDDIRTRLGRPVVDQLRLTVTEILKASLRTNDVISMLAGDRFGVLLSGAGNPDDLIHVAERIESRLGSSFVVEGHEMPISTTAGIVVCGPSKRRPEDFFTEGAAAVASARQLGTSHCMIYDS